MTVFLNVQTSTRDKTSRRIGEAKSHQRNTVNFLGNLFWDGGGIGRGDHFLPHKFIKRTFKHHVNSTKQLLNAGRGHQASRKAAHCLSKEIFNFCFLVFVINFLPLRTQSSVPIFTWERDYWLDCSLPLWTLLFLHQVACVSSLTPLCSTQLCEFLYVPDGGEHLGN